MKKNLDLLFLGFFNAISVFPAYILAICVIVIAAYTRMGSYVPSFVSGILCIFSIFLSPLSCILRIVLGICRWKRGRVCAMVCIILSIIGIMLFAVVAGYLMRRSAIP